MSSWKRTSASRTVTLRKRNMAKHYGEDLRFEQDAVIQKKSKKIIKKLAKLKAWKGDLGNRERPDGLKTRKGGPGKIRGIKKGNILPVDWKPERTIQAKVRDFSKKIIKQKSMTAEAREWRNTLRWSSNSDLFQTFGQQWALSLRDISCYLVPSFTPSAARFIHNNIISKEVCRVFVLQCHSASYLTYFVSFHRVHPSCATIQSYSHLRFIQSYKSH